MVVQFRDWLFTARQPYTAFAFRSRSGMICEIGIAGKAKEHGMQTFEWNIEEVVSAHSGLYLEHCVAMAVALMSEIATPSCDFLVECEGFVPERLVDEDNFEMNVRWSKQTEAAAQRIRRTEQPKPLLERAAIGLAALLYARMMPNGQMRVTAEGDRADYWLPHLQCALEISGTRSKRELKRRRREKIRQLLANPRRWNGYVVLCCCSSTTRQIHWSYHTQEELE